jgi:hypothetical protein
MGDYVVPDAENRIEVASKPHLASDSCVADLFIWLIPPAAGLLFHRPALAEHI